MSTSVTKGNKNKGKTQAAGKGASDVFQCDNKGYGINVSGNASTKRKSSNTSKNSTCTNTQVKIPRILNGKCICCPFDGDIINETIECSKCCQSYHATCRDKRGLLTDNSICSKTFLPKFRALSAHYREDNSRWGNFLFVCGLCEIETGTKVDNIASLTNSREVSVQNSPLSHSKETQSVSPIFISSDSQTLTSGNILESSFNSLNSYVNVCDHVNPENEDSHVSSQDCTLQGCTDIIGNIEGLTKLNEEVLKNIQSLRKLSAEHAASFENQINDIKQTLKLQVQTGNPILNQSKDSALPPNCSPYSRPDLNFKFDPEKCAAYKELHHDILDHDRLAKLTDFLDKSEGFKNIRSKTDRSSRDVLYFGEFNYRYGAIQHEANTIPDVIQPVIDLISEKYPNTIINSCLVTRYKNGSNMCPQHSDDEPFISPWSDIFTMSIGCERIMQFNSISNSSASVSLPSNSLLAFSRASQEFWKHEIPCCNSTAVRYSLTFRQLAPYYANSTLIVGDSNTEPMKFGSGRNTFGVWMPGYRLKAGKIKDIPSPDDIDYPYRHLVIHSGINDLRVQNHLPIPVLMNNLKDKCLALNSKFPKMKIHLSMLLPTKDPGLNAMVSEFNHRIKDFSDNHTFISIISQHNIADGTGRLSAELGRHNSNGTPSTFDTVHLGSKGIALFCLNIKNCIIKKRAVNDNSKLFNDNSNSNQFNFPYWKPNPNYKPARQPPHEQTNPWTGDHDGNFPVRSFKPFNSYDLHNGYQS